MRHHTAVPLADGSGWHYASVQPRRGGYPLGYCAEHEPHATEAEARECYARHQRDNVVLNDGKWSWGSCDARLGGKRCPNPANRAATIKGNGYNMALLCPEHMTLEQAYEALHLVGPAGDAWVS